MTMLANNKTISNSLWYVRNFIASYTLIERLSD